MFADAGGGALDERIEAVTPESFQRTFAVNTLGSLLTVQEALPLMGDGGSVILNGAANSERGYPGTGVHAASRAANRALVRTWAAELGGRHIRVNIVSPGAVRTPAQESLPDQVRDFMIGLVPLKRFGEPSEVAAAALFLASDDSSFITGAELAVDGGLGQVWVSGRSEDGAVAVESVSDRRRGRPRQFVAEDALAAAVAVFAEKGLTPAHERVRGGSAPPP